MADFDVRILRKLAEAVAKDRGFDTLLTRTMREAAAEIERLRDEVEGLLAALPNDYVERGPHDR